MRIRPTSSRGEGTALHLRLHLHLRRDEARNWGGIEVWEVQEDLGVGVGVGVGDSYWKTAQVRPSACRSRWASLLQIGMGRAGVERMQCWDRNWDWDWDWESGSSSILLQMDRDIVDMGDTPPAVDLRHT
jgi:hypothetical protein